MSTQPRKERKTLYNLPAHLRQKQMASHLAEDLMVKHGTRSVVVRKGDTVRVLRGDFKGTTGKVLDVNTARFTVTVEGVTLETAKHAQKPRPLHPSNLVVTRLDLTDAKRREKLGAGEAEAEEKPKAKKAKKAEEEG